VKLSSLLLGASLIPLSGCWLFLGLDGKVYPSDGSGGGDGAQACGDGAPPALELISRNVPVFATPGYPASYANDADYQSVWRSPIPAWVSFDLSQVDVASRQKVVVVWYGQGGDYDHTLLMLPGYNIPGSYFFEVSAAPGGAAPMEDTWKTVVQVGNNTLQSRQHVFDLGGNNWIRFRVTQSDGSPQNDDAAAEFDVFSVKSSICDDWMFFGDENAGASLAKPIDGDPSLPELVANASPGRFPLMQFAMMSGWGTDEFNKQLSSPDSWLATFPGRYVAIALGSKDAEQLVSPDTFRAHLDSIADRVVAAGKVPVVASVPPPMNTMFTAAAQALNAQLDGFFAAHPEAIRGPDLWTPFAGTSGFDKTNSDQKRTYRDAWLDALQKNVYTK
jgi:hypothetical protein